MNELLFPIMSFVAIVGILLPIFSAVKWADEVFGTGPSAKKFGKFFRNSTGVPTFARAYVGATFLMNRIYGDRIFSFRALFVSFLMSGIWLATLTALTVIAYGHSSWMFNTDFSRQVVINFRWFLLVGLLVDYLAVSAARFILNLSVEHGVFGKLVWLTIAALGNTLIFFLLYAGVKSLYLSQSLGSPIEQVSTWIHGGLNLHLVFKTLTDWRLTEISPGTFKIRGGESEVVYAFPEGMLFFSALLTLIWLVFHMVAHWLYFGGVKASRLMKFLVAESSLESKPLQSAATIVGLLVLVPFWIIVQIWHYSPALFSYFRW